MQIITAYVNPPIPIRSNDWIAYQSGTEEEGPYGYGETELEAIENLKSILKEMQMSKELENAAHEMGFVGNYLVQYAAAFNWNEDKGTQRYMLKELLRMADRVADAAAIIRSEIDKGSAD